MSFGKTPSVSKIQQTLPPTPAPPNTPIVANAGDQFSSINPTSRQSLLSFIRTSPRGLTRRASTERSSLIGGS